jgi:hypothetical protein
MNLKDSFGPSVGSAFFGIGRNYSKTSMKLRLDYSFDDVPDPHVMNTPSPTPADFMEHFQFTLVPGTPEDMLANNAGWIILSPRLSGVFSGSCAPREVELLPLPAPKRGRGAELSGYRVLGVKSQIECVDYDGSDILWGQGKGRCILSFRKCVLRRSAVPAGVNCFLIAEYPAFPVVTSSLGAAIAKLRPSGLALDEIGAG